MDERSRVAIDGQRVRCLRRERFLAQTELAALAGVTRETIAKLEMGERPYSHPSTIRKLAQALDVEPRELLKEGRDG
jgi:transcriptional regulator with XRE-family HTH domain